GGQDRRQGPDAVVRGRRRLVALLPTAPELEPAEDEHEQENRVGAQDREHEQADQPGEPDRRVERGGRATAVQRNDRDQVEEVEKEADEGERGEKVGGQRL